MIFYKYHLINDLFLLKNYIIMKKIQIHKIAFLIGFNKNFFF